MTAWEAKNQETNGNNWKGKHLKTFKCPEFRCDFFQWARIHDYRVLGLQQLKYEGVLKSVLNSFINLTCFIIHLKTKDMSS